MSNLDKLDKKILKKHIIKGELLELLPGNHEKSYDNCDSINFFYTILKNKIWAIGYKKFNCQHIKYINKKIPYYPRLALDKKINNFKQFDYIFIQEPKWLWYVEFSIVVRSHKDIAPYKIIPKHVIKFVHNHLKLNGKFIVCQSPKKASRYLHKYLCQYGKYSLIFDKKLAIITKR